MSNKHVIIDEIMWRMIQEIGKKLFKEYEIGETIRKMAYEKYSRLDKRFK